MHQGLRNPSTLLPASAAGDRRPVIDASVGKPPSGWAPVSLAILLVLSVGACGSSNPATQAPSATAAVTVASESASASSPSASVLPSASVSPAPAASIAASPRSQTSTAWGRIWDTVPASFPVYPGAKAGQAPTGPTSASLVATSVNVETVAAWYKAALDRGGYTTLLEPALEDGSRVLDSSGKPAGCKVQTRIAKQGVDTMIGILYGASCPIR